MERTVPGYGQESLEIELEDSIEQGAQDFVNAIAEDIASYGGEYVKQQHFQRY